MDVEIVDMPAKRVGAIRHVGPYNQIAMAFARLGQIAGVNGLFAHPGVEMVALYYDDPESTVQAELRSDAGIALPEKVALPTDLAEQRIPAGPYATTLYVGPYERLGTELPIPIAA